MNIFAKGIIVGLSALALTSCSSDYLDRTPITSVDNTTVIGTTETAQRTVWGICRSMYMGYTVGKSRQFMQGEPWINTNYGEVYGSDCYFPMDAGWGNDFFKNIYSRESNTWIVQMPWSYCYNLIVQSNLVIANIDNAKGDEADRQFIKAQALTLRAHAYTKLMMYFAPRWEESNDGATLVAVKRVVPGTEDLPLVSMKEIMDLIYDDLNTAIDLFGKSGKDRKYLYEPGIEVAQGTLARAALLKHDYQLAKDMAQAARKNHPIMSAAEYQSGFADPNDEWMWCNLNDLSDNYVGFFSWGALYACNGTYVAHWGIGTTGAINIDLYRQMQDGDIRKNLFWTPDKPLIRPARPASFYNESYVNASDMSLSGNEYMAKSIRSWTVKGIPGGDITPFANNAYGKSANPQEEVEVVVPFGAQLKFWGKGQFNNSSVPFMRGAEMAYIEAEADYYLGLEAETRKIMDEVNSKRGITTPTTLSGDALLERMQLDKRIELWGEGFCWQDLKRWRLPIVRRAWVPGDQTSGNFPESMAVTVQPDDNGGWVYVTPDVETEYNELIPKTPVSVPSTPEGE